MSGKFVVLYIAFLLSVFCLRSGCCVTMLEPNDVVAVDPRKSFFLSSNLHIFCYRGKTYLFGNPFVSSELLFTPFKSNPVKAYEGATPKEVVTKYNSKRHSDLLTYTGDNDELIFVMYPESGRQYCFGFQTDQLFTVRIRRLNCAQLFFGLLVWMFERRVSKMIFYGKSHLALRLVLKLLAVYLVVRSSSEQFANGPGPTFLVLTFVYELLQFLRCKLPFTIKFRMRNRAASPHERGRNE